MEKVIASRIRVCQLFRMLETMLLVGGRMCGNPCESLNP